MWIDETQLEADLAVFLPVLQVLANKLPGPLGNATSAVLAALANPTVIGPVVALINQLTGAQDPNLVSAE